MLLNAAPRLRDGRSTLDCPEYVPYRAKSFSPIALMLSTFRSFEFFRYAHAKRSFCWTGVAC